MEEVLNSGPSCCSRDTKGKQGGERMSSENEVSILMRVLKLICSSSSCGNAFKSFLYLKLQMAIDIFRMNKTDNLRIFPLFTLYTYAKLPYWSTLFYHNKQTVVVTIMRPLRSSVINWKKALPLSEALQSNPCSFWDCSLEFFWTSPFFYHLFWANWSLNEPLSRIVRSDWNLIDDLR